MFLSVLKNMISNVQAVLIDWQTYYRHSFSCDIIVREIHKVILKVCAHASIRQLSKRSFRGKDNLAVSHKKLAGIHSLLS